MTEIHSGSCHCGAVTFEVELVGEIEQVFRCNCSLCRRKGALMAAVDLGELKIIKGEPNLSLYQWNTGVAKHYFCKTCGIYTHHQRRINPKQFAFNVACIEGVELSNFENIGLVDGAAL